METEGQTPEDKKDTEPEGGDQSLNQELQEELDSAGGDSETSEPSGAEEGGGY